MIERNGPTARAVMARSIFLLISLCGFGVVSLAHANTAAGTLIQNQATASFEDANGTPLPIATSNTATISVAQIYAATIERDRDTNGTPGATVEYLHVIRNNGNGGDSYTISIENLAGDNAQLSSLAVYVDANGNGQRDPGENTLVASDGTDGVTPSVPAGGQINLVVVGSIPGSAAIGNVIDTRITAVSTGQPATVVTDATDGTGGRDTAQATNDDRVTVTAGQLRISKTPTYLDNGTPNDFSDDQVRYLIEVKNTGSNPAYDVEIYDDLSIESLHDLQAGAGITIVSQPVAVAFQDGANPNEAPGGTDWTQAAGLCEVPTGYGQACAAPTNGVKGSPAVITDDANGDGTTGDIGIRAHDDVIPAGTSVQIVITVDLVDLGSGLIGNAKIDNTLHVLGDLDGDGNVTDTGENQTESVQTSVPVVRLGIIDDTADANGNVATPGVNDGVDDDTTDANDIQQVDTLEAGLTARFFNEVVNTGNTSTSYRISLNNDGGVAGGVAGRSPFPAGTTFTIVSPNCSVGGVCGPVAPGATLTIEVQAKLPTGTTGGGPYAATALLEVLDAAGVPTGDTDTVVEELLTITAPGTLDLSNGAADNNAGANNEAFPAVGAIAANSAIINRSGVLGGTVSFPLVIQNDSNTASSYDLYGGGSWNGTTLGNLPAGWSVTFTDAAGNPLPGGNSTPAIPANGGSLQVFAVVQISGDPTQALANFPGIDIDGDGNVDLLDGDVGTAGDADGDYGIVFQIISNNAGGGQDVVLDAVDVAPARALNMAANNASPINPGSSRNFPHTLSNDGNVTETVSLSVTDSNANAVSTLNVPIDDDGDGTVDRLGPPVAGARVILDDGSAFVITTDNQITLAPGQSLTITNTVRMGSNAGDGEVNVSTVTATPLTAGHPPVSDEDTVTAQIGNVTLTKTAAPDTDCNGEPDAASTFTDGSAGGRHSIEPGDCVIWQIVASNGGTGLIQNLIIRDQVQANTTFLDDSLRLCAGDAGTNAGAPACTFASPSDTLNDDGAEVDGSGNVTWFAGTGADGTTDAGGTLAAGESVTVRFGVTIQ